MLFKLMVVSLERQGYTQQKQQLLTFSLSNDLFFVSIWAAVHWERFVKLIQKLKGENLLSIFNLELYG